MTYNHLVALLTKRATEYLEACEGECEPDCGDFARWLAFTERPETAGGDTARHVSDGDEFMQDTLFRIVEYVTLFQDGLAEQDGPTVLDFCDWLWHKYDEPTPPRDARQAQTAVRVLDSLLADR